MEQIRALLRRFKFGEKRSLCGLFLLSTRFATLIIRFLAE
jgi:hypothetical protein